MIKNLSLSEKLLALTLPFGIAHHIDHVLRVDHSGWPFTSNVTPFTYSLLIYPLLGFAFWAKKHPRWRVTAMSLVAFFVFFAHTLVEPPQQIYNTWAQNISTDAPLFKSTHDTSNLFNIKSPLFGAVAGFIHISLTILVLIEWIQSIREARRKQVHELK